MAGGAATSWDEMLNPWRRASGLISLIQMPLVPAAFALVFFTGRSAHVWAFVATAAVVVLDLVQWSLARTVLGRVPDSYPRDLFATLSLDRRDGRLVSVGLALGPVVPAVLLAEIPASGYFRSHLVAAGALLVAAEAPSFLSLYRVWRRNSWLAVSRIPARPRRSHPNYREPDGDQSPSS